MIPKINDLFEMKLHGREGGKKKKVKSIQGERKMLIRVLSWIRTDVRKLLVGDGSLHDGDGVCFSELRKSITLLGL